MIIQIEFLSMRLKMKYTDKDHNVGNMAFLKALLETQNGIIPPTCISILSIIILKIFKKILIFQLV